jgi:glyoxylase-like metal-dependent hydrolase (beta-lactamase superfamily II)
MSARLGSLLASSERYPAPRPAEHRIERAGGPTLYVFDSRTLGLGAVEVPVPLFLIRHPQGDVLVDGGNPLAVACDAHAHWGPLADQFDVLMTEPQQCIAQLRRLGLGPDSVGHVLQTQQHIDHTGALGHFPNATIVGHARELSLLLELEQTGPVVLTADAADNRAQWEGRERPRALFSREDARRSLNACASRAADRRAAHPRA